MPNPTTSLADKYFSSIEDPNLRNQIVEDLTGVGVTEPFLKNVHVAMTAEQVKRWISYRFKLGQNVIIFGTFGTGKTQIIKQVAKELGYDLITDATSTKLPEDFGGIPMPITTNMSDEAFNAMVAKNLKKDKLEAAIDAELAKQSASRSFSNIKLIRQVLAKKLEPTISVTQDEIDAAKDKYPKSRIEQKISAPDWVFKIIDNFTIHNKKTVMFFDEINQAPQQTLNTLFGLIQQQRFGDRSEYSLADAVIFAGAGNFLRDNSSLAEMSQPLLDRFKYIICFEGDWTGSLNYIKRSYLDLNQEFPHLAKLLADSNISDDAWIGAFSSPRAIEDFITDLAGFERISQEEGPEALRDIDDLDAVGLTARNTSTLSDGVRRFLADIGAPAFITNKAPVMDKSQIMRMKVHISGFTKIWGAYRQQGRVTFASRTYTNSQADALALYKALFAQYPLVTRDALDSMTDANGVSCLDVIKQAGVDEADLPQI